MIIMNWRQNHQPNRAAMKHLNDDLFCKAANFWNYVVCGSVRGSFRGKMTKILICSLYCELLTLCVIFFMSALIRSEKDLDLAKCAPHVNLLHEKKSIFTTKQFFRRALLIRHFSYEPSYRWS